MAETGGGVPDTQAETVMIPDGDRRTACVSSQVGCPVGCRFCASGIDGVKRNLTAAQIVEQVIAINTVLAKAHPNLSPRDNRVNHIVFMGMGEPLANYANLMQAIRVLHDPECLNIGARKITVSTVGVPGKIRELAGEELPINLAISLHAPDEALRRKLIPWAEHFSIDEILAAARFYFDRTGREITLEYILLAGINDQAEHARQLAKLCRTLRANVNLIRYNEVEGLPFGRPKAQDVVVFQDVLRHNGVNAHVRKSRGRDIDAGLRAVAAEERGERSGHAGRGVAGFCISIFNHRLFGWRPVMVTLEILETPSVTISSRAGPSFTLMSRPSFTAVFVVWRRGII